MKKDNRRKREEHKMYEFEYVTKLNELMEKAFEVNKDNIKRGLCDIQLLATDASDTTVSDLIYI